jgi:chromosome partitioning protein
MRIISAINAKGGCGKSTIAISLAAGLANAGYKILLIDADPQAQITAWLHAGDGITPENTLLTVLAGRQSITEAIKSTAIENLSIIASAKPLQDFGAQIKAHEGYYQLLTHALNDIAGQFDLVVIDSPNQIDPIMENVIFPSDLMIVPFESTKAVTSYANFYDLVLRIRGEAPPMLHVLTNLTKLPGLRRQVIALLERDGVKPAHSEIRSCGWLAQVDVNGGSIFEYRPHSNGAEDIKALMEEVLITTGLKQPPITEPASVGQAQLLA